MADRRPLVLSSGKIVELASPDVLSAPGGALVGAGKSISWAESGGITAQIGVVGEVLSISGTDLAGVSVAGDFDATGQVIGAGGLLASGGHVVASTGGFKTGATERISSAGAATFTAATIDNLVLDGATITRSGGEMILDGSGGVRLQRTGSIYPVVLFGKSGDTNATLRFGGSGSYGYVTLSATTSDLDGAGLTTENFAFRFARGLNTSGTVASYWYRGDNTSNSMMELNHKAALLSLNLSRGSAANSGVHLYRSASYQARLGYYNSSGTERWVLYLTTTDDHLRLYDTAGARVAALFTGAGGVTLAGRATAGGASDRVFRQVNLAHAYASGAGSAAFSASTARHEITGGNSYTVVVAIPATIGSKIKAIELRAYTSGNDLNAFPVTLKFSKTDSAGALTAIATATSNVSGLATAHTITATASTAETIASGIAYVATIEIGTGGGSPPNGTIYLVALGIQFEEIVS